MTVITVEHLTKIYHLYDSPTARLKEALHPFRKKYHHDFYALKDLSFEVQRGEVLGIIGQNGCGKSTLLKILAGVLTPTSGAVSVQGNISALLELGSGFNPEFTGLENVYFSSAIMGYTREQAEKNLDAILAFADIGEFIQQPVKTYSSGMYVRLAFAVAINVDPDILIVDEALAVGDEAFQRKCFAKIQAIQERGATILFVSHAAQTVIELCHRALLFDQGELILAGAPKLVVSKYHQFLYANEQRRSELRQEMVKSVAQHGFGPPMINAAVPDNAASHTGERQPVTLKEWYDPDLLPQSTIVYSEHNDTGVKISDVKMTKLDGTPVNHLIKGREYLYQYHVLFQKPAFLVRCGMLIKTLSGLEIGGATTASAGKRIPVVEEGTILNVQFQFTCHLLPGVYFMNAGTSGNDLFLDRIIDAYMFRVHAPVDEVGEVGIVSFSIIPSYTFNKDNFFTKQPSIEGF